MSSEPKYVGSEYESEWHFCSRCKTRRKNTSLLFPFAKLPNGKMEACPPFCIDKAWCAKRQRGEV